MCYVVEKQKHMCIDFYYRRQYAGVMVFFYPSPLILVENFHFSFS